MNESIVSAEAKARLTEAVRNYMPLPPEKYRALEEVKDCIIELRDKKASYQTIRAILHDNAGIEVSHQTIARYRREMLDSKPAKATRREKRSRTASDKTSRRAKRTANIFAVSFIVGKLTASRPAHHTRRRFVNRSIARSAGVARRGDRERLKSKSVTPDGKGAFKKLFASIVVTNYAILKSRKRNLPRPARATLRLRARSSRTETKNNSNALPSDVGDIAPA